MSARAAFLCTLLSAATYGLAFPPYGWRIAAWLTLAPLLVALRGAGVRRAVALGTTWGVVGAYSVGTWLPTAVTRYYAQPASVGAVAFLLCASLTVVPYTVAFALLYRRSAGRFGALAPVVAGATWAASEMWRARSPAGNPWALVGYSQTASLPLIQIADATGVFGISFAVVTINAALAGLWWARSGARAARTDALGGLAVAASTVVAILAYGMVRLHAADDAGAAPVVVVQGNLDLGSQWRPELYGANLEAYANLTRSALAQSPARLVVWPENALSFFLEGEPAYRRYIGQMLAPRRATLVTGGPRLVIDPGHERDPRYLNAAFAVSEAGEIRDVYEKQYLVPFAEYFPLPALDILRRRFGRVRNFTPGTRHDPLSTPLGAAGILICNEALYADVAIDRVDRGAQLLINLSNDGWVGDSRYAAIVFEMARLRAVEVRRWLVRSSTSGPSAIVAPSGKVVARAGFDEQRVIEGAVTPREGSTPYARAGDLFAWACTVLALAAAVGRRA